MEWARNTTIHFGHQVGLPHVEEPVALGGELCTNASQQLPECNRLADGVAGKRRSTRAVHHRRADVVRRYDGVVRRRRGVHHERLVEARVFDGPAAVAHVDHGRLRQGRQQLVGGLSGEYRWPVADVLCGVAVHGVAFTVQRIEAGVAVPRLVEMQPVDAAAQ